MKNGKRGISSMMKRCRIRRETKKRIRKMKRRVK